MKKAKTIGPIIIVLAILIGGIKFLSYKGVYEEFEHTSLTGIFLKQHEGDYYVYFYKQDSPQCMEIEDQIIEFSRDEKNNNYFVDIEDNKDKIYDYNWEEFHTNNDLEIGISKDNTTIQYYEGESEEKYKDSVELNVDGKKKRYEIKIADQEYLKINTNAKLGYVYASLLTPEIDYSSFGISQAIVLAGVPTLLKINGFSIVDYYVGVDDISECIKSEK